MFSLFKKKAKELMSSAKRVENKDQMEAVLAISVLVAYSKGAPSEQDFDKLQNILATNEKLSHFGGQLQSTLTRYMKMYESGAIYAKRELMKELKDVASTGEDAVDVYVIGCEVAMADGTLDDQEEKILVEIGKMFGNLKPSDFI